MSSENFQVIDGVSLENNEIGKIGIKALTNKYIPLVVGEESSGATWKGVCEGIEPVDNSFILFQADTNSLANQQLILNNKESYPVKENELPIQEEAYRANQILALLFLDAAWHIIGVFAKDKKEASVQIVTWEAGD